MERPSDRFIPYYFVTFFVILTMFLGGFVYIAVESHKTVVMERE